MNQLLHIHSTTKAAGSPRFWMPMRFVASVRVALPTLLVEAFGPRMALLASANRSIDTQDHRVQRTPASVFASKNQPEATKRRSIKNQISSIIMNVMPVAIGLGMLGSAPGAHAASGPENASGATMPTVVMVHGAFAESSSWNAVAKQLLARGYPVVAVANPLRGLRSDSEYVTAILKNIRGPVVAVGHSYGGSVITAAAAGSTNVKALVYVAGLAPEVGESAADISDRFPGSTLGPTLAPPVALPGGGSDLYIQQDRFHAQFAADVTEADAGLMAVSQRPVAESALQEPCGAAAWRSLPSWFIFGSLDKNITAAAHSFMAQRAGAKETVEIKGASHVVMVSHPAEVVELVEHAAASPWAGSPSSEPSRPQDGQIPSPPLEVAGFKPAPVVLLASQPPARLVVDAPLPEQLARGYVVVRYRVENLRIMPVYGPSASWILPRIGHLHVTVDDLPWHWLDASGEPLSINGLQPGPHKLLVELESPIHKVIDKAIVAFEIPERLASQH